MNFNPHGKKGDILQSRTQNLTPMGLQKVNRSFYLYLFKKK